LQTAEQTTAPHYSETELLFLLVARWARAEALLRSYQSIKDLVTRVERDAAGKPLVIYYDVVSGGPGGKAYLDWLRKQFETIGVQLQTLRSQKFSVKALAMKPLLACLAMATPQAERTHCHGLATTAPTWLKQFSNQV
jgi:hypothetical protein